MAARAFEHEASLWDMAGIITGAAVVDLGCGPGAFLAALASGTAPSGPWLASMTPGTPSPPPGRWAGTQRTGHRRDPGPRRRLLRPGGHLLCVEPDITGLRFPGRARLSRNWSSAGLR